ncbi:MAG: hypothetical protein NTX50_16895 [Candidatus Sumerlaeota bacterium]|nr:hypothetical protein [Candidatus Sumerlaeota bacterium]
MRKSNAAWLISLLVAGMLIGAGCASKTQTPAEPMTKITTEVKPAVKTAEPVAAKPAEEKIEIIIDNVSASGFATTGEWTNEGGQDGGNYGADSMWAWAKKPDTEAATATWTPDLPQDGKYEVSIWYSHDPKQDHNQKAPFVVKAADKEYKFDVNLRENSGQWNKLGVFKMTKGNTCFVKTTTTEGGNGIADAVKFLCVGAK